MTNLFGKKLRELRIQKGYGLREAARLAGIDPTLWSRFETGSRRPPNPISKPDDAERIIRAISRVLIMKGDDPFFHLMALANLPDDAPKEVVQSLSTYYKRRLNKKKRK